MVSNWDLNAIILSHSARFFQAVTHAIERWIDADAARQSAAISLAGNVLWAESPYVSKSEGEEEMLALVGALAGSLGGKLSAGKAVTGQQMLRIVGEQERYLRTHLDELIETLARELRREGVEDSPVAVDRWVWKRLFPHYSYELCLYELEREIGLRLDKMS